MLVGGGGLGEVAEQARDIDREEKIGGARSKKKGQEKQ